MDFWNNVGRPTAYKKKMVVRNIAKISDCSNALSAPYIVGVTNIQSGKMATLEVSKAFTFFSALSIFQMCSRVQGGKPETRL